MSVLLDHNVPAKFARLLNEWGYEACRLTEHLEADADDVDVIARAQALDAVLLTIDLDFANILDYPPASYSGILVMRYQAVVEDAVTITLHQALDDLYREGLRGKLVIIEPTRYRVRQTPETPSAPDG